MKTYCREMDMVCYVLTVLFVFVFISFISAQPVNKYIEDYVLPSPNVAAMNKYVDIPVSHFTGVPNISIPVYTIEEGPIQEEISLSYHAGGIKVAELASWVGLGWSLNAGGMISRSVVGYRDDAILGYINGVCDSLLNLPFTEEVVEALTNVPYDCEADIFYFNFGGYSGKMSYGPTLNNGNGGWYLYPRSDIKVKTLFGSDSIEIKGFEFLTPQGIRYTFGQDFIEETETSRNPNCTSSCEPVSTAWYLNRISTYDNSFEIVFDYEEERYKYANLGSNYYTSGFLINSQSACDQDTLTYPVPVYTFVKGYQLSSIETGSATIRIDFIEGEEREDLDPVQGNYLMARRLKEIQVKDGGNGFCRGFQFFHSYAQSGTQYSYEKRLKLNKFREAYCNNFAPLSEPKSSYKFTYDLINGLPHRLTKQKDHWGYYNAASTNENKQTLISKNAYVIFQGDTLYYNKNAADRETNPNVMTRGALNKITYPTGGIVTFDYEANTEWGLKRNREYERIVDNRWTNCDSYANFNHLDDGVSFSSVELQNAKYNIVLDMDNNTPTETNCNCESNGRVDYVITAHYDGDSILVPASTITGFYNAPSVSCLVTDLGWKSLSEFSPPLYSDIPYKFYIYIDTIDGDGSLYFKIDYLPELNNPVGGLRVKKIVEKPIIGPPIETSYNYNNHQGRSTGVVLVEPRYGYTYYHSDPLYDLFIRHYSSFPMVNLADINGKAFGYKQVIQQKGANQQVYKFHATKQVSTGYPVLPLIPEYRNGSLLSLDDRISSGSVRSLSNKYEVKNAPHSAPYSYNYKYDVFPCTSNGEDHVAVMLKEYQNRIPAYLRKTREIEKLDGVRDTTLYYYSNSNLYTHHNRVYKNNSDGTPYNTFQWFARDLYSETHFLNESNMIAIPIETRINNGFDGGTKVEYSNTLVPGLILPIKKYSLNTDTTWRLESEWISANADGYPTEIFNRTQITNTELMWSTDPNLKGQLDKVIWGNRETSYFYRSRLLYDSIVAIDGNVTYFEHDALGRLTNKSELNGNRITSYQYGYGTPNQGGNFVKSSISYQPVDGSMLHSRVSTEFYDGLGRPVQKVDKAYGPSGFDVVSHMTYDSVGNLSGVYEPYEATSQTGGYKVNIPANTPYTINVYGSSSLRRIKKVTPPGWHPTTTSYGANSEVVLNHQTGLQYPFYSLRKTVVTDENGNKTKSFIDKKGREVAKFQENNNGSNSAKTYYIYDNRDRLIHIMPPGTGLADMDRIYSFEYDEMDRLIRKKFPGRQELLYRYNDQDLVDSMKDGIHHWLTSHYNDYEQETQVKYNGNQIKYRIYDGFNNLPRERGKLTFERVALMDNYLVQKSYYYDQYGRVDSIVGNHHLCNLLTRNLPCYLKYNYKYDFADNVLVTDQSFQQLYKPILINSDSTIFDHSGRLNLEYFTVDGEKKKLAKTDYTQKDQIKTKHLGGYNNNYLQQLDFTYLPNGYLKKMNDQIGGEQLEYEACYTGPPNGFLPNPDLFHYELGYDQKIHGSVESENRKNGDISQIKWQTRGRFPAIYGFEYDYLNRLKDAHYESLKTNNEIDIAQSDKYDAHITYADDIGNIASITRKGVEIDTTPCTPSIVVDEMTYSYYPESSRIKDIEDMASDGKVGYPAYNVQESDYEYDSNGNMTYDPSRKVRIVYNRMNLPDSLIFDDGRKIVNLYDHDGKKLMQSMYLSDGTRAERRDYIDNIELVEKEVESIHHAEGRLVKKDAPSTAILPDTIDSKKLYYFANRIIAPTVILGQSDVVLEARDSILLIDPFQVVEQSGSEFEARIDDNPPDTSWQWEYYIKDHLGNIRVVFSDLNDDGEITVSLDSTNEILEEHHYYPFGMKHNGPWLQRRNNGFSNRYNYNGKEEMPMTKYMYYGARYMDPAIGRFISVDPMLEAAPGWTPYRYAFNNPLKFIDPDGMYEWKVNSKTGEYERFGDKGGNTEQHIYWDDDKKSSATLKGETIYVGEAASDRFSDGAFGYAISTTDIWLNVPDEYIGEYTVFDLKEREEARQAGGVKFESIQEQESAGLARRDQIWNNKDYGAYLDNKYGSRAGLIMAYDTGLLGSMIPGGFNQAARAGHNALRGGARKAGGFNPQFNSVAPQAKMSWNQFQKATKGQFKGPNSRRYAAAAYKKYKASFN